MHNCRTKQTLAQKTQFHRKFTPVPSCLTESSQVMSVSKTGRRKGQYGTLVGNLDRTNNKVAQSVVVLPLAPTRLRTLLRVCSGWCAGHWMRSRLLTASPNSNWLPKRRARQRRWESPLYHAALQVFHNDGRRRTAPSPTPHEPAQRTPVHTACIRDA